MDDPECRHVAHEGTIPADMRTRRIARIGDG
jgi:hypothetical protein